MATQSSLGHLAKLPRDLRDEVYTYLLSAPFNKERVSDRARGRAHLRPAHVYRPCVALLRASRELHREALPALAENANHLIQVRCKFTGAQGALLNNDAVVFQAPVRHFPRVLAKLSVNSRGRLADATVPAYNALICLDDIPAFVRALQILELADSLSFAFAFELQPNLSHAIQARILKPFKAIQGCGAIFDVQIKGEGLAQSIATEVIHAMTPTYGWLRKSAWDLYAAALSIKDSGDLDWVNGDLCCARVKYIHCRRFYRTVVTNQQIIYGLDPNHDKAYAKLDMICTVNPILGLLLQKDFSTAVEDIGPGATLPFNRNHVPKSYKATFGAFQGLALMGIGKLGPAANVFENACSLQAGSVQTKHLLESCQRALRQYPAHVLQPDSITALDPSVLDELVSLLPKSPLGNPSITPTKSAVMASEQYVLRQLGYKCTIDKQYMEADTILATIKDPEANRPLLYPNGLLRTQYVGGVYPDVLQTAVKRFKKMHRLHARAQSPTDVLPRVWVMLDSREIGGQLISVTPAEMELATRVLQPRDI